MDGRAVAIMGWKGPLDRGPEERLHTRAGSEGSGAVSADEQSLMGWDRRLDRGPYRWPLGTK